VAELVVFVFGAQFGAGDGVFSHSVGSRG